VFGEYILFWPVISHVAYQTLLTLHALLKNVIRLRYNSGQAFRRRTALRRRNVITNTVKSLVYYNNIIAITVARCTAAECAVKWYCFDKTTQ